MKLRASTFVILIIVTAQNSCDAVQGSDITVIPVESIKICETYATQIDGTDFGIRAVCVDLGDADPGDQSSR